MRDYKSEFEKRVKFIKVGPKELFTVTAVGKILHWSGFSVKRPVITQ